MAKENSLQQREGRAPDKIQTKKTYIKPAFRFERVFEVQALSCGKIQGNLGQCHGNRKTS